MIVPGSQVVIMTLDDAKALLVAIRHMARDYTDSEIVNSLACADAHYRTVRAFSELKSAIEAVEGRDE